MSTPASRRQHASDTELHAVLIAAMEPEMFADVVGKLAKAARNVAAVAAENTDLELNMANEVPDLGASNDCIETFGIRAVAW